MDWLFPEEPRARGADSDSHKDEPATPAVSWALGAIPAMFKRSTPHFEKELNELNGHKWSDLDRRVREAGGACSGTDRLYDHNNRGPQREHPGNVSVTVTDHGFQGFLGGMGGGGVTSSTPFVARNTHVTNQSNLPGLGDKRPATGDIGRVGSMSSKSSKVDSDGRSARVYARDTVQGAAGAGGILKGALRGGTGSKIRGPFSGEKYQYQYAEGYTGFGNAKNVSFAPSLGSTTASISEQLPQDYGGADQTPMVSRGTFPLASNVPGRFPSAGAQYDPLGDDTEVMFHKLDENMDVLNKRRERYGNCGEERRKEDYGDCASFKTGAFGADRDDGATSANSVSVGTQTKYSSAEVERMNLERAMATIKRLEDDKRRYMVVASESERERMSLEGDLDHMNWVVEELGKSRKEHVDKDLRKQTDAQIAQFKNQHDTMQITMNHLESKLVIEKCEKREIERKLKEALSRVSDVESRLRESESRHVRDPAHNSALNSSHTEISRLTKSLSDHQYASEQRETRLQDEVALLKERLEVLERQKRHMQVAELSRSRSETRQSENQHHRDNAQTGFSNHSTQFSFPVPPKHEPVAAKSFFNRPFNAPSSQAANEPISNLGGNFGGNPMTEEPLKSTFGGFGSFKPAVSVRQDHHQDFHQDSQANPFGAPTFGDESVDAMPPPLSRAPLRSMNANSSNSRSVRTPKAPQGSFFQYTHSRQPSTTPKMSPPANLVYDVDMTDAEGSDMAMDRRTASERRIRERARQRQTLGFGFR